MSNVTKTADNIVTDVQLHDKLRKLAQESCSVWEPELRRLQERVSPSADASTFAALTAFLGIHCALRLEWYAAWKDVPSEGSSQNPTFSADAWTCLFRPLTGSLAWGLVHGAGLPQAEDTFTGMEKSAVRQSFLDMYDIETQKTSAKANFSVTRSGMRTFATMHLQEAQDMFHQWGIYQGPDAPLRIPVVQCEEMVNQWPQWRESARVLRGTLQLGSGMDLGGAGLSQSAFSLFANALWAEMQKQGLVHVALWQKPNIRNLFGLTQQQQSFHGLFVVVGNRTELWRMLQS